MGGVGGGRWISSSSAAITNRFSSAAHHPKLISLPRASSNSSRRNEFPLHAGLGMSVEGKISTCFTTKCCNCCSPYLREIKATFKVWILPSTRTTRDSSNPLPLIGGDDPSVIYVKPEYEADLDFLIQDTIRLATSVNETCSETCEKAEPKLLHLGARNVASVDRRWHKLLELKKRHGFT